MSAPDILSGRAIKSSRSTSSERFILAVIVLNTWGWIIKTEKKRRRKQSPASFRDVHSEMFIQECSFRDVHLQDASVDDLAEGTRSSCPNVPVSEERGREYPLC